MLRRSSVPLCILGCIVPLPAAGILFSDILRLLHLNLGVQAGPLLLRTAILCALLGGAAAAALLLVYSACRGKAAVLAADRERYYLFSRLAGAWLLEFDYVGCRMWISGAGDGILLRPQPPGRFFSLFHPDDRAKLAELLRRPPEAGQEATLECRVRLPGGAYFWHECRSIALFDRHSRPVRLMARLENIQNRKAREESLLMRSSLDPLTGLLNKSAAALRVDEFLSSRASRTGALFMLDLDNFKSINDIYGHTAGDQALLLTAQVLREHFRGGDMIARVGGDEFLVFLPGVSDREPCLRKAGALCSLLREQAAARGLPPVFTCSVGVALCPEDGSCFSALFDAADSAMYAAKRAGKNACRLSGG